MIKALKRVKKLLKNPPLVDVDKVQNEKASKYFGSGVKGTIGDAFDNLIPGGKGAVTNRSNKREEILYRSSKLDFDKQFALKLHEVTHLAYPKSLDPKKGKIDLDDALLNRLELLPKVMSINPNAPVETSSERLSRYFQENCMRDHDEGYWF